ncbi:hypothetical protein ATCC90586_003542 [Pythium insidiosum]|nr:hypothetical protein ATCC90586_003542 [Pythium insidiosum]
MQRIQENRAKLQALSIPTLRAASPVVRKRARAEQEATLLVAPRRSTRLQQLREAEPSNSEASVADTLAALPSPRRPRRRAGASATGDAPVIDLPVMDTTAPTAPASQSVAGTGKRQRVSCSQLDVDVSAFHETWLGKQIQPKGKQTVMEGLCPQFLPVFSRMSGIQSWRNAVVLFVNVQGASGYENAFTEVPSPQNAVYFRWFAQGRQHEQTPVIQRLLRAKRGDRELMLADTATTASGSDAEATAKPDGAEEPVFLFLRHVEGPYIYCGRLGFLGLVPQSRPLEFRWQLLDASALDWPKVKQLIDAELASAPE